MSLESYGASVFSRRYLKRPPLLRCFNNQAGIPQHAAR
jgi:hypothetical protein